MNRRSFLGALGASLTGSCFAGLRIARAATSVESPFARVRPGEPGWPSQAQWDGLSNAVSGQLVRIDDPLAPCRRAAEGPACQAFFKEMKNPYFLSEDPALTETSGWVDAWSSAPSAYAVKVRSTADVVAAVTFARQHRLRLVIKAATAIRAPRMRPIRC
jgi:hypothetical protein